MDKQLITRVFAILQSLEKYHSESAEIAGPHRGDGSALSEAIESQAKVLKEMRRRANLLQIEIARGKLADAVRSLQIFYGLNQLVRQEVMLVYAQLAHGSTIRGVAAQHEGACH